MKETGQFIQRVERIMEKNKQFKFEAYSFTMAALHHTVSKFNKPRHVTGPELLQGIREYALDQYGMLSKTVLNYWGVHTTEDFGRLVFALVQAGILRKQPGDKIEDFRDGYDFSEAFEESFPIKEED